MVKAYLVGTDERANAEIELNNLQRDLALKSVDYQRQRFDQIQDIYKTYSCCTAIIYILNLKQLRKKPLR